MGSRNIQYQQDRKNNVGQDAETIREMVLLRAEESKKTQKYYETSQRQDRLARVHERLKGQAVAKGVTSKKSANWEDPIVTQVRERMAQQKGKAVLIEPPAQPRYVYYGSSSRRPS
jgi:hypothetical protein